MDLKKWLKFSAWCFLSIFLLVGAILCFVSYDYLSSQISGTYSSYAVASGPGNSGVVGDYYPKIPSAAQLYGLWIGVGLALFAGFIVTAIMAVVTILPDKKAAQNKKEETEKISEPSNKSNTKEQEISKSKTEKINIENKE